MIKKKLLYRAAVPVLTAVCVVSQAGTALAAAGGPGMAGTGYTQGTWQREDAGWKHYDQAGAASTGWIHKESGWYYLEPSTGVLKTGWLQDTDGRWYYLETAADAAAGGVEGRLKAGWLRGADGSWYFMNTAHDGAFGAMVTGWNWIDGACYYFEPLAGANQGKMYAGRTAPDGSLLNADGQWVDENGNVRHDRQGLSSRETAANASGGRGFSGSGGGSGGSGGSSGGSGNGSGGSGGGSGSGNGEEEKPETPGTDPEQPAENSLVKETSMKVMEVDSLGLWLPIVFEDGYNSENCAVSVDGVDVTELLSDVTVGGSIAKLPLIKKPAAVTVTSRENSAKSETVSLGGSASRDAVYRGGQYLPEKLLAHGAIPAWDYYLTNYDEEGNVRISPERTAILLDEEPEAHPSYSPDAVVSGADTLNPSGNVTIMFNYNTDGEKQWFDGINTLQLIQYDERLNTINSALEYTASKNVPHGQGRVGELTIPFGQSNFTSSGRYYVRVKSAAGTSALVPIHVVKEEAPELKIKEQAISGRNLHFDVENLVYGITNPVERVTLKTPAGETEDLTYINDWFLFGDLFVLYNDVTAEEGRNNLPYNGKYTITLYFNGFKTVSKEFRVTGGEDAPGYSGTARASLRVDAVSRATSAGGSGDSGGGSSSSSISADLLFDTDLMVNAFMLNDMGQQNEAVNAIVDWWYAVIPDAVLNVGDEVYYDWTDYYDQVADAMVEGTYLPFEDYRESGEENPNRPYAVKEVLEDGLLGDIQYSSDYARKDAPEFTVVQSAEGQDIVLSCEDAEYMGKISGIYLNGDWKELESDKYRVDPEKGTLTIDKSAVSAGEVKLVIEAGGYKSQEVTVEYSKVNEENLSLKVIYPDGESQYTVDSETKMAVALLKVENSEGDFLKNFKAPVILTDESGAEDGVYERGYEGSDAEYYVIASDHRSISIHNVKPGSYTVSVSANYYEEPLTAEFEVAEGEQQPETEVKDAPAVAGIKNGTGGPDTAYYRVTFEGMEREDLAKYLDAIDSVKVDGTSYSEMSSWYLTENEFRTDVDDDTESFADDCLDLAKSGFSTDSDTTVEVSADGYGDLSFTVDGDGKLVDSSEEPGDTAGIQAAGIAKINGGSMSVEYYQVSFKGLEGDALASYLRGISNVVVGDTSYSEYQYIFSVSNYRITASRAAYDYDAYDRLDLAISGGFSASENTTVRVSSSASDEILEFVVDKNGNLVTDGEGLLEAPALEGSSAVIEGSNIVFICDDEEYLAAITKISDESGEVDFRFNGGTLTIDVSGKAAGNLTLTIQADGYEEQVIDAEIQSADESEKRAPKPSGLSKPFYYDAYDIKFSGMTGSDLEDYLRGIFSVTVGDEEYDLVEYSYQFSEGTYMLGSSSYGDVMDYLRLSKSAFSSSGATQVTITADGYEDLIFGVTADGKLVSEKKLNVLLAEEEEENEPEETESALQGNKTEMTTPGGDSSKEENGEEESSGQKAPAQEGTKEDSGEGNSGESSSDKETTSGENDSSEVNKESNGTENEGAGTDVPDVKDPAENAGDGADLEGDGSEEGSEETDSGETGSGKTDSGETDSGETDSEKVESEPSEDENSVK